MKKVIAMILVTVLFLLAAAICAAAETYVRGDADGSEEVDIIDATVISRRLVDIEVPAYFEKRADVDGSGEVDIVDVTLIQRALVGIADPYGIGETVVETVQPTKDPYELPFIPK